MTMHKARRIRMSIPRGRRRTLAAQFALVGGVVMAAATLVAGFWVSDRIEHGVLRNSANATAHYMESVISPLSQELARSDRLSEDSRRALRRRVQEAAARSAAAGEQTLRRIGADLHDGPAQLLAFAALRLDALRRAAPAAAADIDAIESALRESIRELRAVSRGLSRPEVERLSPPEIVEAAVEAHRMRTRDAVRIDIAGDEAPALSAAARISIFRFVQEALNNAHRHAGGEGLRVELRQSPTELRLRVLDAGPGPGAAAHGRASTGLGLAGLRDRVESLGGEFFVRPRPQGGTEVAMVLCAGDDR